MNNTNIFSSPWENTQFFSVMKTIIILGKILYNDTELHTIEIEPIPIINALCTFLDKNRYNEIKILDLGHKLLQDTEFYGSKQNESLHIRYVNAMLNNIIANTVFSKFGNTFGYLSAVVNSTRDLKLPTVKEKIIKNLHRQTFLNDNGTFSLLTNTTIERITENIIFPLFPQPERNMSIINLKYIYAQAGWIFLRTAQENYQNTSFSELISLAKHVEQEVIQGNIDPSALQIFQLPALLYYTYQKDNGIKRKNLKFIMVSTSFWHRVYSKLFTDLNVTSQKMIALLKKSSAYRFHMAFSKFKNRTAIAEEVLQNYCPNITDYTSNVIDYKNNPEEYYCNKQLLPNINQMFSKQIESIAEKYYYYEKDLINHVFDEDLKKFIDQTNVTIKPIKDFWKYQCFRCAILSGRPTLSSGIDLFQISDGGEKKQIYALIRSTNGMKLVPATDINSFLINEIGLNERAQLDIPFMAEDMKSASDDSDFNTFVTYIAKYREKKVLANLKNIGYEATTTEKVLNFFKHLIPFYSCAESINGDFGTTEKVMNCIFDSLVMLPVVGVLTSVGMKVTTTAMKSALLSLGVEIQTLSLREAFRTVLKTGFRLLAVNIIDTFSQIITKQFFRDFGIAILRALDPGVEFVYILTKAGATALMKSLKLIRNKFSAKGLRNPSTVSDVKIGDYKGHTVQVQSISGQDGFGFKRIDFQDKIVELRRIRGYSNEMPVVVVNEGRVRKKFKILDLETGKLGPTDWEEEGGVLVVANKPLTVRLRTIITEGLSGRGAYQIAVVRLNILDKIKFNEKIALDSVSDPVKNKNFEETLKFYVLENSNKQPADIVEHWLEHKTVPIWCEEYKISDRELFRSLRFAEFVEDSNLYQGQAVNQIMDLYGQQYTRDIINVDVDSLSNFYFDKQLHNTIAFNDQFAIANFITSGYSRIHFDDLEAWNMKRALYKAALRQYDDVSCHGLIMTNFISTDMTIPTDFFPLSKGQIFETNQFTILKKYDNSLISSVDVLKYNSKEVMNYIYLDEHFLAVYLFKYLPFKYDQAILLPGVKLRLENWELKIIDGESVILMQWRSLPIDHSKWLADTFNKIKFAIDKEQLANSVLMDFDTSLL
ncbi:uncharacterized protein LOC127286006 [Leptopilina boulardi]|uniref:uncharacterized protein LOC127286006 n=1 Tax=Leptopilina boulardi TaxID=63433 RepID=UPI0021F50B63|nr:uncharacterized protein LOC127286006 [Leptopilina boulardi]XP_051168226.1 uncharacterized protein LOC127286006 [Leptopilina boulardi]